MIGTNVSCDRSGVVNSLETIAPICRGHCSVGDKILNLNKTRRILIGVIVFVFFDDFLELIQILWAPDSENIANLLRQWMLGKINYRINLTSFRNWNFHRPIRPYILSYMRWHIYDKSDEFILRHSKMSFYYFIERHAQNWETLL